MYTLIMQIETKSEHLNQNVKIMHVNSYDTETDTD